MGFISHFVSFYGLSIFDSGGGVVSFTMLMNCNEHIMSLRVTAR